MLTTTSDKPQDIPFATFVSYLETVASRRPRKANRNNRESGTSSDKAADDFREWANKLKWPVPPKTGAIIFRLLFPEQDIRRKYNLQEALLGKYLGQVLEVSTGRGKRGEGLLRWNSNREDHNGVEIGRDGCLGLEVAKIRADTELHNDSTDLKLADVDRLLDELAARSSWSNLETTYQKPHRPPVDILKDLYRTLSARQSAFITQIILKDLRPLLYPLPSVSTYRSLMDYNRLAFDEIVPYSMMKAWHWAMPRIYRTKADFDRAANLCEQIPRDHDQVISNPEIEQLVKSLSKPELGTPVNIPKAIKASGPCLAATLAKLSGEVWAETKMDGERMQIHIDTSKPDNEQIQIFSKSHRNSTKERASTQVAIRASLGLPASSKSTFISSHPRPGNLSRITSGIFEAEMVAWDMTSGKVDEFWRISELKLKPWQTVRHVDINTQQEVESYTQELSESQRGAMNTQEISDLHCRHLAVCFFDVLYLNDQSLVDVQYSKRRAILEKCVHVIPSYCMLVDRKRFDFNHPNGRTHLREYYAEIIAERHEGLMLKTAESVYNDWKIGHRWFKVKKDYIDGLGDTADYAVIGASWDRDRGRELRVSTATYTVWYIGLCTNARDVKINPSTRPDFKVVFKALSYGLTRPQLEKVNQMARDMGSPLSEAENMRDWSYTYHVASGLGQPTIIFKDPFVFELMGSGFTKQSRRHEYELRWPRITKVHDHHERDWTSAIDLETHNQIARRAIDPEILRVSHMIGGGDEERAEDGFKAETDLWNRRLLETDSKWQTRNPRQRFAGLSNAPLPRTIPSTVSRPLDKSKGKSAALDKSKGKSAAKQIALEDHTDVDAEDHDNSSPPLDLPTDDLPPLTTDAYKIEFKKSSTRSLPKGSNCNMPLDNTSSPTHKSSRSIPSSSLIPPVSVVRDAAKRWPVLGEASCTSCSPPHAQSHPQAPNFSSEPITINSSPPPSESESTLAIPTATSSSVIHKKKRVSTKGISPSKPALTGHVATPSSRAPGSTSSLASHSATSTASHPMPKASLKRMKVEAPKTLEHINPSPHQQVSHPGAGSVVFKKPEEAMQAAKRSTDTEPTKSAKPAANRVVLPLKSSMKRKRPVSPRGSTGAATDLPVPSLKPQVKVVTFQQGDGTGEATEGPAPVTDAESVEPTAPIVDTKRPEPPAKRPKLSDDLSSSKGEDKATDPASDAMTIDPPERSSINLETTMLLVDQAESAPNVTSPEPLTTTLRADIVDESRQGNCSTSTGPEKAGSSTATDNLPAFSAAPWRQANDVGWCLVRDQDDYGISGKRYNTVAELLQSIKIQRNRYYSDPETARVCYIFIENPTETTLKRIQKQIVLRALSDPNVTIVGYNSKVLEVWEGNGNTWKKFELFRFNSYDEDFEMQQARIACSNQNQ